MSDNYLSVAAEDFSELGLNNPLMRGLQEAGYTTPTPIQAKMIPHVIEGRDVVGQAQTGTGKTAAFALPLLNQLQPAKKARPQILVLTPTRELALQVAESFMSYGKHLHHMKVLAVYGGEEYSRQLQQLSRGVNVVVGTPGRTMDHIRRGSLQLDGIQAVVLDEADEMLKMGFIDDVEWTLDQIPVEHQTALFSATMPASIRRIAQKYLEDPVEITIKQKTVTADTVNQRYLLTRSMKEKKEALGKVLEASLFDGVLIFVRTRLQTVELSEYLTGLGYSSAPLNGDIPQNQRLRTVEQLKSGKIDILVATDVAARGLDVERISHVMNFDIPFDTESYIHRIGRTGRAGRSGEAILFLYPREKSMLRSIEKASRQRIQLMDLPTVSELNAMRKRRYKEKITSALASDCSFFEGLVDEYCRETDIPLAKVSAALAKLVQGDRPLLVQENRAERRAAAFSQRQAERSERPARKTRKKDNAGRGPEQGMERYRIAIGDVHGVRPGNIVGAIANEADIDSEYIGRISIFDEFSTVDLPEGMPTNIQKVLQKARINGRMMKICKANGAEAAAPAPQKEEWSQTAHSPKKAGKGKRQGKARKRGARRATA